MSVGYIDGHTHWIPSTFPKYAGKGSRKWPALKPADSACQHHVMFGDSVYRTVPDSCWNSDTRRPEMMKMRACHHVLSPMPELLSYWLPLEEAVVLTRFMNEELAALCSSAPATFTGLGAVPLQDVQSAVRELEHCMKLGLAGAEIGSNVEGKPPGHPDFREFFAAAAAMGAAIFVHALRPSGIDRIVGPASLVPIIGFPNEIGLAAASVLTSGLMEDEPGLRMAFSHGAGSLIAILPRLQHAWESVPALRGISRTSPRDLAKALFVDDLVYDGEAIRNLLATFGRTQVFIGSDYPFAVMDGDPLKRVEDLEFDALTTALVKTENVKRWLGRKAHSPVPWLPD